MEQDVGRYRPSDFGDWVTSETRFENFVTDLELGARIFIDPRSETLHYQLRRGSPVFAWRVHGTASGRRTKAESYFDRKSPGPADWGPDNAHGLKGMSGGVAEWVLDSYEENPSQWAQSGPYRDMALRYRKDPVGRAQSAFKSCRGGSWASKNPGGDYAAQRFMNRPQKSFASMGFRLVT
jgi:formylglycine-generating enzyme required for sulfatase activity